MDLKLDDFLYDLPEDRVAKFPPKRRGESKLLFYSDETISHHRFAAIDKLLPKDSLLVFNDTRVIPARIIMTKDTGARIEIFLLEPVSPSHVHEKIMNETYSCTWKCMIGNAKKWKQGSDLTLKSPVLKATRITDDEVRFSWDSQMPFSDLLVEIGKIPLPPYIDREVSEDDRERYQTIYSRMEGAVAAPTAGLHFNNTILKNIKDRAVRTDFVTLHVSAGTFQPIKTTNIGEHNMHNEQIWITKDNILNLLNAKKIIAVGTTSMRTLESLYWFGVKLSHGGSDFLISQTDPYTLEPIAKNQALEAILDWMNKKNIDKIGGQTEIFIYPGYTFRICEGLVTNFHLPGSTLILLVSAFIGDDWKKVYKEAIDMKYNFLSYGDSSLLLKNQKVT